MSRRTFLCQLLAAAGAATLLTASGAVSLAQDATPSATKVDDAVVHPVSIHQGTCDEPVPQPVGQTADSQIVGLDDDALFIGATSQPPVVSARLDFDGTIDDLTETPHVVAVHTSPQEYGSIVACGEIAGFEHDGTLVIPVLGTNDSGVSGIAVVSQERSLIDRALGELDPSLRLTDDSVSISVYLIPADATPAD